MATNRLIRPRSPIDWSPPSPELVKALSLQLAADPAKLVGYAAAQCLPCSGMPMPFPECPRTLPATGGDHGDGPAALLLPGAAGSASTSWNPATSAATCSPSAGSGLFETVRFRDVMSASPLLDLGRSLTRPGRRIYMTPTVTAEEAGRLAQQLRGAVPLRNFRNSFEQLPAAEQPSPAGWTDRLH